MLQLLISPSYCKWQFRNKSFPQRFKCNSSSDIVGCRPSRKWVAAGTFPSNIHRLVKCRGPLDDPDDDILLELWSMIWGYRQNSQWVASVLRTIFWPLAHTELFCSQIIFVVLCGESWTLLIKPVGFRHRYNSRSLNHEAGRTGQRGTCSRLYTWPDNNAIH